MRTPGIRTPAIRTQAIRTRAVRARAMLLAAGVAASGAAAQTVLRPVALEGDPVPALPGVTVAGFGLPAVGAQGRVGVSAVLAGPGVSAANDIAILSIDAPAGSAIELVTREGDPPPAGAPGEVFGGPGVGLGTPPFSRLAVGFNGEIAFSASLTGPMITSGNDTGLWFFDPVNGYADVLIREGALVPGTSITVTNFFTPSIVPGPPQAPAWGLLAGQGVSSTNNSALLIGAPGGPIIGVREGQPVGGVEIDGVGAGDATAMSIGPYISLRSRLRGPGVTAANDEALLVGVYTTSTAPPVIIREGDPAPAPIPGAVHAGPIQPADTAETRFAACLSHVSDPVGGTREVIWFMDLFTLPYFIAPAAFTGETIFSMAPGHTFAGQFSHPVITSGGINAFSSDIAGPGVIAGVNDRALFVGGAASVAPAIRRGDATFHLAPGEAFDGPFIAPCINSKATAVFSNISGPVTPGVDDGALLFVRPGREALIAMRLGGMVEVTPGNVQAVVGLAFADGHGDGSGGQDGRPSMLDDSGRIVMRLDFANGTSGIYASRECYANCDNSWNLQPLDLFDFLCFVNRFGQGHAYADCDGSGSLDLFDFLCFVSEFNAGCP